MKIFIDAGHNDQRIDTGACGNGLREQDITFEISQKLMNKLKNINIDVIMSRTTKTTIIGYDLNSSLKNRATMANEWKADLFISIHCNSATATNAKGTEVYVYNTSSKIYTLANNICKKICESIGTVNRGVKTANFSVLRNTTMPAMLIETAFISNSEDAKKLKNNQNEIVEAIFSQIVSYYGLTQIINNANNIEDVASIVAGLNKYGIVTDKILWLEKLKNDNSAYWLAKKSLDYINNH